MEEDHGPGNRAISGTNAKRELFSRPWCRLLLQSPRYLTSAALLCLCVGKNNSAGNKKQKCRATTMKLPFPPLCTERWRRPFSAAPPEPRGQDNCAPFFSSPPPFPPPRFWAPRSFGSETAGRRKLPSAPFLVFLILLFAPSSSVRLLSEKGEKKNPLVGRRRTSCQGPEKKKRRRRKAKSRSFSRAFLFPLFLGGEERVLLVVTRNEKTRH